MPYCPKCGNQVSETSNFCRACGQNLKDVRSTDNLVDVEKKVVKQLKYKTVFKTVSVILLICGIVTLIGVFLPWDFGWRYKISGWSIMDSIGIQYFPFPFFIIAGSIVSIVCSSAVLILTLEGSENIRKFKQLEIIATIATTITFIVALPPLITDITSAGGGLYIITIASLLGSIAGLMKSLSHV